MMKMLSLLLAFACVLGCENPAPPPPKSNYDLARDRWAKVEHLEITDSTRIADVTAAVGEPPKVEVITPQTTDFRWCQVTTSDGEVAMLAISMK
jgi:hypothetical protein